jgi:hypothetical protein
MPPPLPPARALLAAAARASSTRAFSSGAALGGTSSGKSSSGGDGTGTALSLYRAALRAIRALPDPGARDYYRLYARQNLNEFRDESDPARVSQLVEHGRASLAFLRKKHAAEGSGSGRGGSSKRR